jgi:hypothetical protein
MRQDSYSRNHQKLNGLHLGLSWGSLLVLASSGRPPSKPTYGHRSKKGPVKFHLLVQAAAVDDPIT